MIFIGIAGGSGSGKTTVVRKIVQALPEHAVSILSQDAYYKDTTELTLTERKNINFDHPDSIEFSLMIQHLEQLKRNETIEMPVYSYVTCLRSAETIPVFPRHVIIIEGILILTCEELRTCLDMKVFVDAEPDDRLTRIIRRDIEERGRTFSQVLEHYETFVKPMHYTFIEPTKRYADIIIPQGGSNIVAIDILTQYIKQTLQVYT